MRWYLYSVYLSKESKRGPIINRYRFYWVREFWPTRTWAGCLLATRRWQGCVSQETLTKRPLDQAHGFIWARLTNDSTRQDGFSFLFLFISNLTWESNVRSKKYWLFYEYLKLKFEITSEDEKKKKEKKNSMTRVFYKGFCRRETKENEAVFFQTRLKKEDD